MLSGTFWSGIMYMYVLGTGTFWSGIMYMYVLGTETVGIDVVRDVLVWYNVHVRVRNRNSWY